MNKLLFIISFLLLGCNNIHTNNNLVNSDKEIIYNDNDNHIDIDSISFDASMTSSQGFFHLEDSVIVFADRGFAALYYFDLEGNFIERKFGMGNGPNELLHLNLARQIDDSVYFILFDNNRYYLANKFNESSDLKKINWGWEKRYDGEINPRSPVHYKPYSQNHMLFETYRLNKEEILMQVNASDQIFSGMSIKSNADLFYKEGGIFAIININTGDVLKIIGNYPAIYKDYKYLYVFKGFSYDINISNNYMYLGFNADSLIHISDFEGNILKSFGFAGKDMNTNYVERNNRSDYMENYRQDINTYGYYSKLYYDSLNKYIFRQYVKGKHSKYDGLQIYDSLHNLIGDVLIPKNLLILGRYNENLIGVNFLSHYIIDEDNFILYKISI